MIDPIVCFTAARLDLVRGRIGLGDGRNFIRASGKPDQAGMESR